MLTSTKTILTQITTQNTILWRAKMMIKSNWNITHFLSSSKVNLKNFSSISLLKQNNTRYFTLQPSLLKITININPISWTNWNLLLIIWAVFKNHLRFRSKKIWFTLAIFTLNLMMNIKRTISLKLIWIPIILIYKYVSNMTENS